MTTLQRERERESYKRAGMQSDQPHTDKRAGYNAITIAATDDDDDDESHYHATALLLLLQRAANRICG